jgi:hypothetical protein
MGTATALDGTSSNETSGYQETGSVDPEVCSLVTLA